MDPFISKLVANKTTNICSIHRAFEDLGNGSFRLRPNWSLAFTHARLTTGDRPTTIASLEQTGKPLSGQGAGDLWKKCTGSPVTALKCCVYNCPNPECNSHLDPSHAQNAGATAHVYGTFQSSDHDIRYMILLPTCSFCNNHLKCRSSKTNFPLEGEEPANILYTITGAQLMFIEVKEKIVKGKGAAGKGTGKGGEYHGEGGGGKGGQGKPSGPPPGVNVIGWGADFKQLLYEVFVTSGIIKAKVTVISLAQGRGW